MSSSSSSSSSRAKEKSPLHQDVEALLKRLNDVRDQARRQENENEQGIARTRNLIVEARGKPGFQRVLDKGLQMAILARLPKTSLLLINSGADPNARPTVKHRTTLLLAIDSMAGPERIVPWDSDQQDSYNSNPRFYRGMKPVVLALIEKGADIFARVQTHRELSPARRCAEIGRPQLLGMMLEKQGRKATKEQLTEFAGDACTGIYLNAKRHRHYLEDPAYLKKYDKSVAGALKHLFSDFPESVWPDFNVPSSANGLYPIHALASLSLFRAAQCISQPRGASYSDYAMMTARCRFPRPDLVIPRARLWTKDDMLHGLALAPVISEDNQHDEWEHNSAFHRLLVDEPIEEDGVNAMDLWANYPRSVLSEDDLDEFEDSFELLHKGFDFFESRGLLPTSMTLFYAVRASYTKMVEFLLAHKRQYINLTARDSMGKTVLHWACLWEDPGVMLQYRAFTEEERREYAAASNPPQSRQDREDMAILEARVKTSIFDLFLEEEVEKLKNEKRPDLRDKRGRSLQHFLLTNPYMHSAHMYSLLSKFDASHSPQDNMGREPVHYLMLACPEQGRVRRLEQLDWQLTTRRQFSYISNREFSNRPVRDKMGLTPLHFFVMGAPDYPDVAKLLVRLPGRRTALGPYDHVVKTLCHLALLFGAHPPSFPDLDYYDDEWNLQQHPFPREYDFVTYLRPLHLAAAYGNSMMVVLLLYLIGKMKEAEEGNYTYRGRGGGDDLVPEAKRYIVDCMYIAVPEVPSNLVYRGAHGVFRHLGPRGWLQIMKALHMPDSRGNLPIHYAVESGDWDVVFTMLNCEKYVKSQVTLHVGSPEEEALSFVQLSAIPDGRGRTPLQIARANNSNRIAQVIATELEEADNDLGEMMARGLSLRDSRRRKKLGQPYVPQDGDLNELLEDHPRGDELVERPITMME